MPLIQASLGTDPVMLITLSRHSSVDEISERYNLNYDIVAVKLFHPYQQFTRNVRLSRRHRRSKPFPPLRTIYT